MLLLLSQIKKSRVQHLSNERKGFPRILFDLHWTGGKPVERLFQRVPIEGTVEKDVYFHIRYNPKALREYTVLQNSILKDQLKDRYHACCIHLYHVLISLILVASIQVVVKLYYINHKYRG